MFALTEKETSALEALGQRLEYHRLRRNEKQAVFAARLGTSVPTYRKMANGEPTVKLGYWVRAVRLLTSLDDFDALLAISVSYFSDNDSTDGRKRVKRT